jgi:hypothetical protein
MFSGRRSARSGDGVAVADGAVAVNEPRGAAGFSLLFGASVSGVVEISFTG